MDTAGSSSRDAHAPEAAAQDGPARPPSLPGYVLHTLLGRGAYGQVWLGESRTTRRQVAVKILRSRATLDWSLLDSETEKLAFLAADRRVVQLVDVGRDADPPYFVMEYVARGSLAQHLEEGGPLPPDRAVKLFEEIALGLVQVHAKGILHCDLKPSNVLLDDELHPRLADFGQSRMSDAPAPASALGTLFYMAPEQASPGALPDARWDVYALGAVLFAMLEGRPPHWSRDAETAVRGEPDLARRLARYRQLVEDARRAPLPARRLDKALSDILARCLAVDPNQRFATVQQVVEALRARSRAIGRRPLLLLGGLGPLLLLAVMVVFGVRGYRRATEESEGAIRRRAFESNKFAAAFIARSLEGEIRRYFEIVAAEAAAPGFQDAFRAVLALPDRRALANVSADSADPVAEVAVERFRADPARRALDVYLRRRLDEHLAASKRDPKAPRFGSLFALDAQGLHLAAAYSDPELQTRSVGLYYAWRAYFHGGPTDLPRTTPRASIEPIRQTLLSAPFRSSTANTWRVGVSTPLHLEEGGRRSFAGVLVFSVEMGDFAFLTVGPAGPSRLDRFAVLVDARPGAEGGRVVLHPHFAQPAADRGRETSAPAVKAQVDRALLGRMTWDWQLAYQDPLGAVADSYRGDFIAAAHPLRLPGLPQGDPARPEGLVVLVQERAAAAIGPVEELGGKLVSEAILALVAIALTIAASWFLALRASSPLGAGRVPAPARPAAPRPLRDRSTLSETEGQP